MNKRIITLSMMSLLAIGTLTGCSTKVKSQKTDDKKQVIVKIGDTNYTADDLFGEYSNTTSGASAYYNAIYDILVAKEQTVTDVMKTEVNTKIDEFTQKAKDNASTNGTTYKTELSTLLEGEGVENINELRQVYLLNEQKTALEDKFYQDNMKELTREYIQEKTPYHISHILVKTDDAGSSLYDGKITSSNATSISSVIESLVNEKFTFGQVAKEHSEDNANDKSSASMFGDLGIMDQDTGFVSEFKYGVFAYDAYLNKNTLHSRVEGKTVEQELNLDKTYDFSYGLDGSQTVSVKDALSNVNEIPYKAVEYLSTLTEDKPTTIGNKKTYEVTINGQKVEKDVTDSTYPRNVLFNRYFNNHGLSVITDEGYTGTSNRFESIPALSTTNKVLCDENHNPILVTRAGSSYQGIHFIVINRSPFTDDNLETLVDYYSTDNIPSSTADVTKDNRFITAIKSNNSTYTDRADTVKSAVKGFDKYLSYRIYENLIYKNAKDSNGKSIVGTFEKNEDGSYKLDDGIVIEENIKKTIQEYIDAQRSNSLYTSDNSVTSTLKSYVQLLTLQSAQKQAKQLTFDDIKNLYDDIPSWLL